MHMLTLLEEERMLFILFHRRRNVPATAIAADFFRGVSLRMGDALSIRKEVRVT